MIDIELQNPDVDTTTKVKKQRIFPKFYAVVFHNDDYTPIEFVIQVLVEIFNKNLEEATSLTMYIHNHGKGVAGIYTYEIANQKCMETLRLAKIFQFPLLVTVEES